MKFNFEISERKHRALGGFYWLTSYGKRVGSRVADQVILKQR